MADTSYQVLVTYRRPGRNEESAYFGLIPDLAEATRVVEVLQKAADIQLLKKNPAELADVDFKVEEVGVITPFDTTRHVIQIGMQWIRLYFE